MKTDTNARCTFPGHPGPAGHIPACQLCPSSPTYWRTALAPEERSQVEAAEAGQWKPAVCHTAQ